jgi:Family of unknown function (DUF6356)
MHELFTRHPGSVGESYWEHMRTALSFGGSMLVGALACLVHAFLPFLFERTGSSTIAALHHRMVVHRSKASMPSDGQDRAAVSS